LIETEMVSEEVKEHALKMIPMQRMGQVEEVAKAVKFYVVMMPVISPAK
jgi:3-oxoacyl-[acyl-carrier protein] reductase